MNTQPARQRHAPTLMDLAKAGMLYFPENEDIHRRLEAKRKRDARKAKKRRARRRERRAARALQATNDLNDNPQDENAPTATQSVNSSNDQSLASMTYSTDDSDVSLNRQTFQQLRSAPEDIPFLDFFPEMAPFWQKSTRVDNIEASNNKIYDAKLSAVGDDLFAHWLNDTVCSDFTNDEFWDDNYAKPVEGLYRWVCMDYGNRPARWNKDDGKDQPRPQGDPPAVVQVMQSFPEFAALWKESSVEANYGATQDSGTPTESPAVEATATQSSSVHVPLSDSESTLSVTIPTEDISMSDHNTANLQEPPMFISRRGGETIDDFVQDLFEPVGEETEFQPASWDLNDFEIPDNSVLVKLEDLCECCRQKTTEKQATRE
ncbi:hypothetical protein ACHAPJ_011070 [Fusarium lateritium]